MITATNLTKKFGNFTAVDNMTCQIKKGCIYGLVGSNGAGKSTTMNIITGCLSATAGSVLIDGYDIFETPDAAKKSIGYLPEHPPLYMSESPLEYLQFVGEAKGLRGSELKEQVNNVIEKTGIANVMHRRISTLSKGYKQRVGIAQALLGNPKIIILDEPTVGLDPIQIIEIRELIMELGQTHTVIFSSHILSEVQAICDQILMIAKGKLVAFGEPDEIRKQLQASNEITITTDATQENINTILTDLEDITDISITESGTEYNIVNIKSEHENIYDLSSVVFKAFAQSENVIYEMSLKRGNLEDIFIELSANTNPDTNENSSDEAEAEEEFIDEDATDENAIAEENEVPEE